MQTRNTKIKNKTINVIPTSTGIKSKPQLNDILLFSDRLETKLNLDVAIITPSITISPSKQNIGKMSEEVIFCKLVQVPKK